MLEEHLYGIKSQPLKSGIMEIIKKYFSYCFQCETENINKGWVEKFYLMFSNWR